METVKNRPTGGYSQLQQPTCHLHMISQHRVHELNMKMQLAPDRQLHYLLLFVKRCVHCDLHVSLNPTSRFQMLQLPSNNIRKAAAVFISLRSQRSCWLFIIYIMNALKSTPVVLRPNLRILLCRYFQCEVYASKNTYVCCTTSTRVRSLLVNPCGVENVLKKAQTFKTVSLM